ncbi:MAG: nodulation protein NfeD [Bryobacterales bacterium]|nr:nodulation protein NfeD [Bryobacterales bacterium]
MARLALLLLLLAAAQLAGAPLVIAVDIDGVVHPVTVEILAHALDQARTDNAELILIRLNTPGGLMEAMRQAVEKLIAAPAPVVTYVTPSGGRAASAGFFVLLAGDVAAMAPGTTTGAASPVLLAGEMDAVMRKKVENDAAAFLRTLADKRGRNAALAEQAVLASKSFTDKEALDGHLVELVAKDEAELLRLLDGRAVTRFDGSKRVLSLGGAAVVAYRLSWRERMMKALSDPNVALILLVLGALGVYVEFSSPGLIVPGVAGGILALLGLSALSVLPINWLGAALLLLAVALFVLEAKFASHGVLGAGGALAMVLGAVLLVESPLPELRVRLVTAIALTLPFALITVFLLSLVLKARARKVVTGVAGLVGTVGVAHTPLNPAGKIFVHGEYWDAVSSRPLEPGARARITAVEGLVLKVEPE